MEVEKSLFSPVKFHLGHCHDPEKIRKILIEGGASCHNYVLDFITHVIADFDCPAASNASEIYQIPIVNSLWVHLSLKAKVLLPHEAFSPYTSIFSNVVAYISNDLSKEDRETIAATLTFYGARLTKDIQCSTHIIVPKSDATDLTPEILSSENFARYKVVAPDWITDSIKQNMCCNEQLYDPSLLLDPPPPTPSPVPQPVEPTPTPKEIQPNVTTEQKTTPTTTTIPTKPSSTAPVNGNNNQPQQNPQVRLQFQQRQQQSQPGQVLISNNPRHQLQQSQFPLQSDSSQPPIRNQHNLPISQLPRPRIQANVMRDEQPKFRPLLPPMANNLPMNHPRHITQHPRVILQNSDQKMVSLPCNPQRKMSPYQNSVEMQQQPHDSQSSYAQVQHHPQSIQQPVSNMQPSRLPQPNNMYHQPRVSYQNNHMQQQRSMPQQQQPMMNSQAPNIINKFQDPNAPIDQRPYQICLQPQQTRDTQYKNVPINRQTSFYNQQSSTNQQIPMRMSPKVPIVHTQTQNVSYNDMNSNHQQQRQPLIHQTIHLSQQQQQIQNQHQIQDTSLSQPNQHHVRLNMIHQQPYRPQQPFNNTHGQNVSHHQQIVQHQQPHPSQQPQTLPQHINQSPLPQQHHQQSMMQPRANFSQNMPLPPSNQIRPVISGLANHQIELPQSSPRLVNLPNQNPMIGNRMPMNSNPISVFESRNERNVPAHTIKPKAPEQIEDFNYFGHNPKETIPKDMPLIGCRFNIIDDEEMNPLIRKRLIKAIELAGGSVSEHLDECTHLICDSRLSDTYIQASKQNIRCVTFFWVDDILVLNKLTFPWKALHLPVPFSKNDKPLKGQLISITNIRGRERFQMIEMLKIAGATYTDYFSTSNSLVVCGNVGGDKYERAIEWKIPIANCQIISDILLNGSKDLDSMLSQPKYQIFNREDPLKLKTYQSVLPLMKPWRTAISIESIKKVEKTLKTNGINPSNAIPATDVDDSGIVTSGSNGSEQEPEPIGTLEVKKDSNCEATPANQTSFQENGIDTSDKMDVDEEEFKPALETLDNQKVEATMDKEDDFKVDITEKTLKTESNHEVQPLVKSEPSIATKLEHNVRKSNEPIRLLFSHLEPALTSKLESYALKLGMSMATSPANCTHLVMSQLKITSKFVLSLSRVEYVVSHEWLEESNNTGCILDEKKFILQDKEAEEKHSFNLIHTLLNQRKRSGLLFDGFVFFVTPGVLSALKIVKEMIESAGGRIASRKLPSEAQLNEMRKDKKKFLVISCKQDLHLCSHMSELGVDIVSIDFIVTGILRQEYDIAIHRLAEPKVTDSNNIIDSNPKQITHVNTIKKLRFDETIETSKMSAPVTNNIHPKQVDLPATQTN